jgi:hypothetical protein
MFLAVLRRGCDWRDSRVCGILVGAVWSYAASSLFTWRPR